jgi:hypothetical protein
MSKESVILFDIPSIQTFISYPCLHSNDCNIATICFGVWSWNEDLTTALQYFAVAGAYYVTFRQSQSSLNHGIFSMFRRDEVCILRLLWEVSGFSASCSTWLSIHCFERRIGEPQTWQWREKFKKPFHRCKPGYRFYCVFVIFEITFTHSTPVNMYTSEF